jgi:alanine racemase
MDAVKSMEASGIKIPFKHVCNSGAILSCPEMYLDGVRTGKLLYGIPLPGKPRPFPVRTIVEVKTALADIRTLPPRSGISYGLKYTTRGEQKIGIIPMGTYDGFTRLNPNPQVLVRGVRVPAVGTICMDHTMIDLTDVPDAAIDDEVVIIGRQGNEEITLTEVVNKLNTIYSQTLALFPFRMPRFYK